MANSSFNGFTSPKPQVTSTRISIDAFQTKFASPLFQVGEININSSSIYRTKVATDGTYVYVLYSNTTNLIKKFDLKGNLILSVSTTSGYGTVQNYESLFCFGDYLYLFSALSPTSYYIINKNTLGFTSGSLNALSMTPYGFQTSGAYSYYVFSAFYINNTVYLIGNNSTTVYIDTYSISPNGSLVSTGYYNFSVGSAPVYSDWGIDYSKSLNSFCIYVLSDRNNLYTWSLDTKTKTTIDLSSIGIPAPYTTTAYTNYFQFYCCAYGNIIIKYRSSAGYCPLYYINSKTGSLLYSETIDTNVSYLYYNLILVTKYGFWYFPYSPSTGSQQLSTLSYILNNTTTSSTSYISLPYTAATSTNSHNPLLPYYQQSGGLYILQDNYKIYIYSESIPLI